MVFNNPECSGVSSSVVWKVGEKGVVRGFAYTYGVKTGVFKIREKAVCCRK